MLTPGSSLGRYRIESLLGEGGMGAVYRAQDTTLRRPVAIKVLRREIGSLDVRERLLREAQSASALNHPNICTVYEVGEEGDWTFIAMEYVDGPVLSATIANGPLDVHDVLRHGIDIADALAHAHERGVVHRDLKTANAIVSSSGRLKLVDFGLARRLGPVTADGSTLVSLVQPGDAIGTPYAMAPEQVRGEAADPRTDLWALGVLLYEMLSATHPFRGATVAELFASILRDPPIPLRYTRASAPLHEVVATCLAKDPDRRYQRAAEARLALEECADDARPRSTRRVAAVLEPAQAPVPAPPGLEPASGDVEIVGRAREFEQLTDVWKQASAGRRQLVLLAGEPGIGKTRLTREFARRCASEHATVLLGRCEEEALIPYQPFVEALSWYARSCPESALRAQLAAIGGGDELGPFVPDFVTRIPDLPAPAAMNAQGQRYRLFETVSALLAAASTSFPVLLLIDDLHWADKPTLSLLRHIARGSEQASLCVVGTYRESELAPAHPLGELLADLRREQGVTRISLAGLDQAQVAVLVEALAASGVSPVLAQQVAESTDGNPFFVGEVMRHLRETGALALLQHARPGARPAQLGLPEGVREVIERRVSRLSDECNRVLTLAAVLGREFDLAVLEALSDISEDPLLDALDEARRAQLVDEVPGRPGRYTFHHALIRDTVYGGVPASRRLRLHRRAGEAFEKLSARWREPPLSDLAHHFVQAAPLGVADKAADYAGRAADRMAEALAHEEAARFYDLALQALDSLPAGEAQQAQRVALHRRRGRAFGNLAQWGPQRAALEEALRHLAPGQVEERCEILAELSQAYFWLFDVPSLERSSLAALSLAEQLGRDDIAANAMGWLARCRQAGGDTLQGIDMDRVTIARFGAKARVAHSIGSLGLYWAGRGSEAVALTTQAVEMTGASKDASFTMNSLSHHGLSLATVGRYTDAMRVFAQAQEFGRKYGALPLLARATSMSAGFRLSVGDLDGAEAIQQEARELARSVNFPPTIVSPGIDLLLIAARRHAPGSVEQLFLETVDASTRTPGWHGWLWELRLWQVRAELALARGDWEKARLDATESIERSRRSGRRKYETLGRITRAQALKRLERLPDAIADAKESVSIARSTEDPALLLQALDVLLQLDGDDDLASEARATTTRILDALPDDALKRCFTESEAVQRLQKL